MEKGAIVAEHTAARPGAVSRTWSGPLMLGGHAPAEAAEPAPQAQAAEPATQAAGRAHVGGRPRSDGAVIR